jgi:hypothetical protein
MLRIAVVYVLIATAVLVYLVVVSQDGTIMETSRAETPGNNIRAKRPVRANPLKMLGSPRPLSEINDVRRRVRAMLS